jgi:hypothetical protein
MTLRRNPEPVEDRAPRGAKVPRDDLQDLGPDLVRVLGQDKRPGLGTGLDSAHRALQDEVARERECGLHVHPAACVRGG